MKESWKTLKNDFPAVQAAVKDIQGKTVNVGVMGENAWLAGIHEFGCRIPVTPKMRAWFEHTGYPLKKTTTTVVIPERSFLRAGFDEYHKQVIDLCEEALGNAVVGQISADQLCEMVGLQLATKIKAYAAALKTPPDSAMTIAMKGSSNPLVDTGDMIESITYEVK